jgi:hypothetical protein
MSADDVCECGHSVHDHRSRGGATCHVESCLCIGFSGRDEYDPRSEGSHD